MSESDAAPDAPSDARIRSALRDLIIARYKSGAHDDLTLKRVRKAVEEQLNLPANWFKEHGTWNAESKEFITEEVQRVMEDEGNGEAADTASDENAKPTKKLNGRANGSAGRKRKSDEIGQTMTSKSKPRKKRKVESEEEAEHEGSLHDVQNGESAEDPPKPAVKKPGARRLVQTSKAKQVVSDEDSEEETAAKQLQKQPQTSEPDQHYESDAEMPDKLPPIVRAPQPDGNDSESSLSSLLDEPPPKSRAKKTTATKSNPKAKSTKKGAMELTPDEEEIKKLQSWLLKCGIRKVWGKELKPFPTPREKIKHLKGMLSEAGMTGRFSVDKARQIKESRELAADLEAVKEYDDRWGSKEEEAGSKTRGSMAKSLGLEGLIDSGSDDE